MQILKPIVHETVWGGKKLTPYSGSNCEKIGHLYSCIDTKSFKSEIISGSFKEALQKPLLPSRMEQKCSVQFFLTTPGGAVFYQHNSKILL